MVAEAGHGGTNCIPASATNPLTCFGRSSQISWVNTASGTHTPLVNQLFSVAEFRGPGPGEALGVDGISAHGLVDGSRVIRRDGWNSVRLYRTGRRRLKPSVRCSEPEWIGPRSDADTFPHALQSVGAAFDAAEHGPLPDDPDRCPDDQWSADDVRIAFDWPNPGRGGDALPLTNLEPRDVLARSCAMKGSARREREGIN